MHEIVTTYNSKVGNMVCSEGYSSTAKKYVTVRALIAAKMNAKYVL